MQLGCSTASCFVKLTAKGVVQFTRYGLYNVLGSFNYKCSSLDSDKSFHIILLFSIRLTRKRLADTHSSVNRAIKIGFRIKGRDDKHRNAFFSKTKFHLF